MRTNTAQMIGAIALGILIGVTGTIHISTIGWIDHTYDNLSKLKPAISPMIPVIASFIAFVGALWTGQKNADTARLERVAKEQTESDVRIQREILESRQKAYAAINKYLFKLHIFLLDLNHRNAMLASALDFIKKGSKIELDYFDDSSAGRKTHLSISDEDISMLASYKMKIVGNLADIIKENFKFEHSIPLLRSDLQFIKKQILENPENKEALLKKAEEFIDRFAKDNQKIIEYCHKSAHPLNEIAEILLKSLPNFHVISPTPAEPET